jgi:hypothetical protein
MVNKKWVHKEMNGIKSGRGVKFWAQFRYETRILYKMAEGNNASCYNKPNVSIEQSLHNEV